MKTDVTPSPEGGDAMTISLYDFQEEAVSRMLERGSFLLADEMG